MALRRAWRATLGVISRVLVALGAFRGPWGAPGAQPWDDTWGVLGLLGDLVVLGRASLGKTWALFGFLRASECPEACLARDLGVRPGALGALGGPGARLARDLGLGLLGFLGGFQGRQGG